MTVQAFNTWTSLLGQGAAYQRLAVLRSEDAGISEYCHAKRVFSRAASVAQDKSLAAKETQALDGQADALKALISHKASACNGQTSSPTSMVNFQTEFEGVLVRVLDTETSQLSNRALSSRASLADIYMSQGRTADARRILDISIPPTVTGASAAQISLMKAQIFWMANGPTEEVGALLAAAAEANPMDPQPQLKLGQYWFSRGGIRTKPGLI